MRLALTIGHVDFEDDRFAREQWPTVKVSTPYGSVPVMTIDGDMYCQSDSMLRYAGKLAGMYPADDALKALFVDEVMETCNDLATGLFRYKGSDKEKLREDRIAFMKENVPRYWGGLEKRLEAMGAAPFVMGEKVSIADLKILSVFTTVKSGVMDFIDTDVLDSYPRLFKIYGEVMAIPEVAEWYTKHPIPKVVK